MLKIAQSANHAIKALACLGRDECSRGLVKQIAKCSGVPAPYLAKLFTWLSEAGVIGTKRGRAGGSWLARPPEEISLIDIVEAVDGREWQKSCLLGNASCSDVRACPVHDFWRTTRRRIEGELRGVTLRDVIAFQDRKTIGERGFAATKARDSITQESNEILFGFK